MQVSTAAKMLKDKGSDDNAIGEINQDVILRGLIQCLRPRKWLNDEIENFNMTLLNKKYDTRCNEKN